MCDIDNLSHCYILLHKGVHTNPLIVPSIIISFINPGHEEVLISSRNTCGHKQTQSLEIQI